jgi:hypothetical protein
MYDNMCNGSQVYNLFRQLGLRHIFVVPRPSRVVGLITRKDLLLEVMSHVIVAVVLHIQLRNYIWLDTLLTSHCYCFDYRRMGILRQQSSSRL